MISIDLLAMIKTKIKFNHRLKNYCTLKYQYIKQLNTNSKIFLLIRSYYSLLIIASFSSLVLIVGLIISGLVFIVASTIIIILCLKHRTNDNDSYQIDIKKGVSSNGTTSSSSTKNLHSVIDSHSSGAESDIKVELRTASSMSQNWDTTEVSSSDQTVSNELAKVVENIYSYTKDPIYVTNNKVSKDSVFS
jgi:hypothetical protein